MEAIYLVFELIQIALGKRKELSHNPSLEQWKEIRAFAYKNALAGIVYAAIEQLPKNQCPDKTVLMELFAQAALYKRNFYQQQKVAQKLAKLWHPISVEPIVLKGQSVAQYYPIPEYRYSCDLDLFADAGWQDACSLLESEGLTLEYEVYKEAQFRIDGVYVEFHRFVTPVRGKKNLHAFEVYLRDLLAKDQERCDDDLLRKPPLMFNVMLCIEHALGDLLNAHLSFKHIVDWMVLRNLPIDKKRLREDCEQFGFARFLTLLDSITDVVEGKKKYQDLNPKEKRIFDELIAQKVKKQPTTWFKRRVEFFFEIVTNAKRFKDYGYCSMPSFLFHVIWAHYFQKEVKL